MGARAPWAIRHELPGESDERLTDRAREGDQSAFGELYRRHRKAAESTAWCLLRSKNDADDVVADAFAGVLSALRNGRGPRDNFRRYLLACVRNGCRARRSPSVPLSEPSMERLAPVLEEPEQYVEANTVARAFAALTPRWQHTLWLTEVEQRPPHEVSERMQLSPNATAALAHRARQAFATAYLAEHVGALRNRECIAHAPQLAAYVRRSLGGTAKAALEHHLVICRDCAVAAAELRDINASLRSIALPGQLLAAGAAVTTGAVTTATAAVTGTATTATAATATAATAVTATATATSVWATLSGAGVLVKALVAIVLVAPAISSEGHDAGASGAATGRVIAVDTNRDSESAQRSGAADTAAFAAAAVAPAAFPAAFPDVAIAIDDADETDPAVAAPPEVGAAPLPDVRPVVEAVGADVAGEVAGGVDGEVVGGLVDGHRPPVNLDLIRPVVDNVIEPVMDSVVEPVVQGLDEALVTMGLGSTGQTVDLVQSIVPLLDGPLVDLVVTDLLGVETVEESGPAELTDLFSGLQETDGSDSPASPPPVGGGTSLPPGPAASPTQPSTVPAVIPVPVSPVAIPEVGPPQVDLAGVAVPAITLPPVDLPPVAILDFTVIDLPAVELPALELPPLDLSGLGLPPLTLPTAPQ